MCTNNLRVEARKFENLSIGAELAAIDFEILRGGG